VFVGCGSVLFDLDPTSKMRREKYGRCGDFRPTPYGIEYRTMGNYALNSPTLVRLVWALALHAMDYVNRGNQRELLDEIDAMAVQRAVNTHDPELARRILSLAGTPARLMQAIEQPYHIFNWIEEWAI
jgi:hypothetical protein